MKAFEEIKFMEHFELFEIAANDKLDLSKADKAYYSAKELPEIVEVKNYNYLNISGVSSPEDSLFINSIEAIYALAYNIKFKKKFLRNFFFFISEFLLEKKFFLLEEKKNCKS